MPPPVALSEFTLSGVALGERSDISHGVSIRSGVAHDGGILEVTYELRESRWCEACGDALTFSLSLVGIGKIQLPFQFVQLPAGGLDQEPIPIGPDGGRKWPGLLTT